MKKKFKKSSILLFALLIPMLIFNYLLLKHTNETIDRYRQTSMLFKEENSIIKGHYFLETSKDLIKLQHAAIVHKLPDYIFVNMIVPKTLEMEVLYTTILDYTENEEEKSLVTEYINYYKKLNEYIKNNDVEGLKLLDEQITNSLIEKQETLQAILERTMIHDEFLMSEVLKKTSEQLSELEEGRDKIIGSMIN